MGHFVMPLVLSLLSVIHTFSYHNRQCLLYNGKCVAVCPRDMHPYHTRCDGQTISQLTCSSPLQYIIGFTCGWSRCDCNGNLFWDDQNGYCVNYSECPVHVTRRSRRKNRRGERRKGDSRIHRKSKRVEIREETEPFNDK